MKKILGNGGSLKPYQKDQTLLSSRRVQSSRRESKLIDSINDYKDKQPAKQLKAESIP
jgi:hypothetical protein